MPTQIPLTEMTIIAGPCVAESFQILDETAHFLVELSKKLRFQLIFKSSFDKANRSSIRSYRGPGLVQAMDWFERIKSKYHVLCLTDVHETAQVKPCAEMIDVLQIPAFLCRQTDLIVEAAKTGRAVNIKKGQFMAPESMKEAVLKIQEACDEKKLAPKIYLTERGASFGYGNLVVDMRSFAIMAQNKVPIIFDVTHSLQLPPSGATSVSQSSGVRHFAPILARAAAATGYVDGFFMEVHPDPSQALSDAATQLNFKQFEYVVNEIIKIWICPRFVQEEFF